MRIWQRLRDSLQERFTKKNSSTEPSTGTDTEDPGEGPLWQVRDSLHGLLEDARIPAEVRTTLEADFGAVEQLLERLENGHLDVVVLGRVSVGKSSLLNALLGRDAFRTSPLHGETTITDRRAWSTVADGQIHLCDTPGLDEIGGESRESLAHRAASMADVILFVVEGDLTRGEWAALQAATGHARPVLLVLNKADRYTADELQRLLTHLRDRTELLMPPEHVLAASAVPAPRIVVEVQADGTERERVEARDPDVTAVAKRLWAVVEGQGQALVALNAGLFASRLSDEVAARITELRRDLARRVVDNYALGKGVAVGVNPVPAADLAAAAALDASLIIHLGRIYGLPVTRRESWRLLAVIITQLGALMGSLWTVGLFSSALKLGTGGVSTALTASAQGAVGYASTWILGRVAEEYFRNGRSWGEGGPKRAVQAILEELDTKALLARARADVRTALEKRG